MVERTLRLVKVDDLSFAKARLVADAAAGDGHDQEGVVGCLAVVDLDGARADAEVGLQQDCELHFTGDIPSGRSSAGEKSSEKEDRNRHHQANAVEVKFLHQG